MMLTCSFLLTGYWVTFYVSYLIIVHKSFSDCIFIFGIKWSSSPNRIEFSVLCRSIKSLGNLRSSSLYRNSFLNSFLWDVMKLFHIDTLTPKPFIYNVYNKLKGRHIRKNLWEATITCNHHLLSSIDWEPPPTPSCE